MFGLFKFLGDLRYGDRMSPMLQRKSARAVDLLGHRFPDWDAAMLLVGLKILRDARRKIPRRTSLGHLSRPPMCAQRSQPSESLSMPRSVDPTTLISSGTKPAEMRFGALPYAAAHPPSQYGSIVSPNARRHIWPVVSQREQRAFCCRSGRANRALILDMGHIVFDGPAVAVLRTSNCDINIRPFDWLVLETEGVGASVDAPLNARQFLE